jgi:hypothetical protein
MLWPFSQIFPIHHFSKERDNLMGIDGQLQTMMCFQDKGDFNSLVIFRAFDGYQQRVVGICCEG